MKSFRFRHVFIAATALLLASLACSQVNSLMPAATEQATIPPVVPTTGPTDTPASKQAEVILEEKFADNSNNWYVGKDKDTEVALEGGKYKVRVLSLDNVYWFTPPVTESKVDVTVDTEFTEGAPENAAYGLLCNYKDADNHYRFRLGPDGTYSIDKRVNGGDTVPIVSWTGSSAIKTGTNATNTLHIICNDSHLTMYVNDTLLSDVIDTSLTGGSFQLMASGYANKKGDNNPVGVSFSNLVVRKTVAWEPQAGTILTDTFDDNKNTWDVFTQDTASGQVENGQLVMKVMDPETSYMIYSGLSLSEVDMSFDVVVQEGTSANSAFGAICRRSDADNRYMFDISADGSYTINKRIKSELTTLVDWKESNAIKTGKGEVNRVRVVCSGSKLELYVNGELLTSATDTDLTGGTFALQAGRFKKDNKPVTINFDNLEVKYPEK
jgi:hypothetical protein